MLGREGPIRYCACIRHARRRQLADTAVNVRVTAARFRLYDFIPTIPNDFIRVRLARSEASLQGCAEVCSGSGGRHNDRLVWCFFFAAVGINMNRRRRRVMPRSLPGAAEMCHLRREASDSEGCPCLSEFRLTGGVNGFDVGRHSYRCRKPGQVGGRTLIMPIAIRRGEV